MIPNFSDLEEPILRVLERRGGQARPEEVYEGVKRSCPQLTESDLVETVPSGDNKFKNRIRWVTITMSCSGRFSQHFWPNSGSCSGCWSSARRRAR
jgi:hypothetical protein